MKNLLIAALLGFLLAGFAFAQAGRAPAPPGSSSNTPEATPAPVATAAVPDAATAAPAGSAAAPASGSVPSATASSFLETELKAAAAEVSSRQVGTMTIDDIEKITAHLTIAVQKERYVQRIRNASFLLPGAGQFMAGDDLGGWLFVAWDVSLLAGTLISAYFVLPSNVQFGSLDYLNSPLSTIKAAWESNSLASYLPLIGVLAAGVILETGLRYVSADNAARRAQKNISEGKVTFQPSFELGNGGLGFGLNMMF